MNLFTLQIKLKLIQTLFASLLLLISHQHSDKLGGITGGTATTTTAVAIDTVNNVDVFNQHKTFAYDSANPTDNLIIRTTDQNFSIGIPHGIGGRPLPDLTPRETIYFSVENQSGVDQNVKIVLSSKGNVVLANLNASVLGIFGTAPMATVSQEPVTTAKTAPAGTSLNQSGTVFIPAGQTAYFQGDVYVALKVGETADWTLEAFGDNNAYGYSN